MSALLKELQTKTAEINDIKKNLVKELQPKFKDIFLDIFEKYPAVKGAKWTQYTPYFNDGEACTFSVHDMNWSIEGIDGDYDDEWSDGIPCNYSWYWNKKDDSYDKECKERDQMVAVFGSEAGAKRFIKDAKEVQSAVTDIPDDIMEDLFGDHVEVIVTRNGVEVEEYSHD